MSNRMGAGLCKFLGCQIVERLIQGAGLGVLLMLDKAQARLCHAIVWGAYLNNQMIKNVGDEWI